MKYVKKPVSIEARHWVGPPSNMAEVSDWVVAGGYPWLHGNVNHPDELYHPSMMGRPTKGIYHVPGTGALQIRTPEGDMEVRPGDWIIRGTRGEFYPCKPDMFADTYEPEKPASADRPDWTTYFFNVATAVAARGECQRSRVGAVLVTPQTNRIVATGYNGAGPGEVSCLDGACPRQQNAVPPGTRYDDPAGQCIARHAEENALNDAHERGLGVASLRMFVTKEPCERCAALLAVNQVQAVWPGKE